MKRRGVVRGGEGKVSNDSHNADLTWFLHGTVSPSPLGQLLLWKGLFVQVQQCVSTGSQLQPQGAVGFGFFIVAFWLVLLFCFFFFNLDLCPT